MLRNLRMFRPARVFSKPKKLYKYISVEGAKDFFKNPSLWFRLSSGLNDIFDLNPVGANSMDWGMDWAGTAVFCLSETPTSAPMWAHYGSQGKGVVLEFSLESDFFDKYPPKKVRYRSRRPTIKEFENALITKDVAWSYEREWRCVTHISFDEHREQCFLPEQKSVSIPFPFETLTAIIYGPHFNGYTPEPTLPNGLYEFRADIESLMARPEASHVKR